MSYFNTRRLRPAAGLGVLMAFAVMAVGAQADPGDVSITLTGGSRSTTIPAIAPLTVGLTGVAQTVTTTVGAWSVTDATGSNDGYRVTVAASVPTVGGSVADAGTGGSITLTPKTATVAAGNSAATGPVAASAQPLSTTAATIQTAADGTGQGKWDFAADSGLEKSLSVVIPGDASAGAYTSTLTFTAAPRVA